MTAERLRLMEVELEAYVDEMIETHTRLIEVTVRSHDEDWEATKHPYPAGVSRLLAEAREKAGWPRRPDLPAVDEFKSDQQDIEGTALVDESGTFTAESEQCTVCLNPLLIRSSVVGPFTVSFSSQQYYIHAPFHQDDIAVSLLDTPDVEIIPHHPGHPAPSRSGSSRVLLRQLLCLTADGKPLPWRGHHHFPHVLHDSCARSIFRNMPKAMCPSRCNLSPCRLRPECVAQLAPPPIVLPAAALSDIELQQVADAMRDPRQCPNCHQGPIDYAAIHALLTGVVGRRRFQAPGGIFCPNCGFVGSGVGQWPSWQPRTDEARARPPRPQYNPLTSGARWRPEIPRFIPPEWRNLPSLRDCLPTLPGGHRIAASGGSGGGGGGGGPGTTTYTTEFKPMHLVIRLKASKGAAAGVPVTSPALDDSLATSSRQDSLA